MTITNKRVGVLSNPRSGTSLILSLLLGGFDFSEILPPIENYRSSNIYHYRIMPQALADVDDTSGINLISIIRDPRSVITSYHPSFPSEYLISFEQWKANYDYTKSLSTSLNICEIRYEELVSDPYKVQQDIEKQLKLTRVADFHDILGKGDSAMSDWQMHSQLAGEMGGLRPLDNSLISRWKSSEFSSRIRQQLNLHPEMTEVLIELGYEDDASWEDFYRR